MAYAKSQNWGAVFGPTPDCIEIDELARVIEGQGGGERQRAAQAHVSACAHCQTELALLQEFTAPHVRADEKESIDAIVVQLRKNEPVPRVAWWHRFWTPRILAPVALGFAALLVVVAVGLGPQSSKSTPFVPDANEALRSQSINAVSPVGDVIQRPAELQWQAVAGAAGYRVRVMEVDRTELWNTTVSQTKVALPLDLRQKIVPLKTLVWEVTALSSSGFSIASSGFQHFRLQESKTR